MVYDHVFHSLPLITLTIFWNRLLPLMISRLMLSLKKASKVGGSGWTSNALSRTHPRTITQVAFRVPPTGPEDTYGAPDLSDRQVRGRSGERTA